MAEPIKVRAKLEGDTAVIQTLMNHPMETGQRKDAAGKNIPIHFIQNMTIEHNGKVVLAGLLSQGIAKNPMVAIKVKGAKAGDKVKVSWVDNKGDKNSIEEAVK
jgi:sulfur-oxidizing protein SoxZ